MLYEVASVLRAKKEFPEDAIQNALRFLLDTGVEIFTPTEELFRNTIHLTFRTNLSFYDCLYVALADQLGAHLLTADQAIYKKAHVLLPVVLVQ